MSDKMLLGGIGHKCDDVRRITSELLVARRAMPAEIAEQLITDSDAMVRLAALNALLAAGRTFSDVEVKNVLVKRAQSIGGLIGALGGLSAGLSRGTAGEACWIKFKEDQLRSMHDKDLEAAASEMGLDRDAQFILIERQFAKRGKNLRRSVDDQYKAEFARVVEMASVGSARDSLKSLEDFVRKKWTRRRLDIICRKGDAQDLGRVRDALKSGTEYSAAYTEYLRRFGEWEDIPLIVASVERPDYGSNSLLGSIGDNSRYRSAASAVYEMGRARLSELLAMAAPSQLLSRLIVEASDNAFRGLTDASILALLRSEEDAIRKAAAVRCLRAFPKLRVARLLADYVSGDPR